METEEDLDKKIHEFIIKKKVLHKEHYDNKISRTVFLNSLMSLDKELKKLNNKKIEFVKYKKNIKQNTIIDNETLPKNIITKKNKKGEDVWGKKTRQTTLV